MLTLPGEGLREGRDDAIPILFGHSSPGGQAKAVLEEAFADFTAVHLGAGEDRLEMHGLPDGAGLDVLGFQREPNLLAGDARYFGINGQASQPAGRLSPRSLQLHGHAWQRHEGFGVGLEMSATTRDFAGETGELAEPDAGGDIAETVIITDGGMLVMRRGVPRLGRQETRLLGQFGIVGDKHAAAAGGDDLVTVERMDAEEAERTGRGFSIGRAKGFSGILDELHAMPITAGLDGGDIRRLAVEVDEHQGLGLLAGLYLLLNDRAGERGIHVPALFFGIDEDGLGSEVGDGRGRCDEGERRTKYFIPGADSGETEGEMQGGGAGRNGDGMFRADDDGEIFFERVEIRTGRRDPIGLESFQDVFDFRGADIGRGEVDAVIFH